MDLAPLDVPTRAPFTRFEIRQVEDREASEREGRWVGKDVDFAIVSVVGGMDEHDVECSQRKAALENQVRAGRVSPSWLEAFNVAYKAWKSGLEAPLNGTPILGWPVISPAEQKNLINIRILTVEDLAGLNSEGLSRVGMGAVTLKNKATAWLASINDHGKVVQQVASLSAENTDLKNIVEAMQEKLNRLQAEIEGKQKKPKTDVI